MKAGVRACSSIPHLANSEATSSECSHNKAINLISASHIFFVWRLSCTLVDTPTRFCSVSRFHSSLFPSSSYPALVRSAFRLERVAAGDKFPFSHSISRLPEPVRIYSPHTVICTVLLFLTTLPIPAMQVYVPLSHAETFLVKFWACDRIVSSFWMVKLAGGAPGTLHHRSRLSPWSRRMAEDSSFGLENNSEKPVSGMQSDVSGYHSQRPFAESPGPAAFDRINSQLPTKSFPLLLKYPIITQLKS